MTKIIPKIAVLDYGMGNVGSILNMLKYIGVVGVSISEPNDLDKFDGLILPGVGHFDRAMNNLNRSGMSNALSQIVSKQKMPILGICLGMQLMCKSSEEGQEPGLGFFDANVIRFDKNANNNFKIPHMGWNNVLINKSGTILGDIEENLPKFYFVHSYYVDCNNSSDIIGLTKYGVEFVSAISNGNLTGVQFHPEKSHKFGMNLLKNFINTIK